MDFSRFWWALYTDYGWTFADIVDVIDLLETADWDGRDEPDADPEDQPAYYLVEGLIELEDDSLITPQMFDDWIEAMNVHGVDR